ncbi:KICSTOR complex protein kaptin-like isoform X2 [Polistes fuscatus]|uniref:KICSTOR complex protein kaptin-like isoform X2 n=1 Tax=Polistes fuscatus TaxID=30207 RepID=UPI001CA9500E|nr:KICSTOR complex protein kaptin-like isoform X2 [Polistes fuscatus]
MSNLIDAHWFPLASQSNIYSMTQLCSLSGVNKVLVASLKRKIYSCEYHITPKWNLRPVVKELLFTYIPNGAEIIAIDAYNKMDVGDGFVIGITIIKTSTNTSVERYLNIYSEGVVDGEGDENSTIETIAQNCLMVELSYTPYHLYHTILPHQPSGNEVIWLISGSDYKIHMIMEDKLTHGYIEPSIEKYFPELHNIQAICLWINVYYFDNYKWRLSAIGCECGLVKVTLVDVLEIQMVRNWSLRYDKPISSIRIFPHRINISPPSSLNYECKSKELFSDEDPILNILIGNTNINMDGQNEILLGTYGQEVLIFALSGDTWELSVRKLFDAPVHSITYMDITNDGMKELIVLTQRGVHILQHNTVLVKDKWKEMFKNLFIKSGR